MKKKQQGGHGINKCIESSFFSPSNLVSARDSFVNFLGAGSDANVISFSSKDALGKAFARGS